MHVPSSHWCKLRPCSRIHQAVRAASMVLERQGCMHVSCSDRCVLRPRWRHRMLTGVINGSCQNVEADGMLRACFQLFCMQSASTFGWEKAVCMLAADIDGGCSYNQCRLTSIIEMIGGCLQVPYSDWCQLHPRSSLDQAACMRAVVVNVSCIHV